MRQAGRAPAQVSGSCGPHGVVLNVHGLRRPSIRARWGLPSSRTPFSGCAEHFVSRNLQRILPHQHSKTAEQSGMNVPPLPFTQETGAGAREDWSPRGQPFTSASLPTSNTAACPANKVYTAQFMVPSWKLHFLSLKVQRTCMCHEFTCERTPRVYNQGRVQVCHQWK